MTSARVRPVVLRDQPTLLAALALSSVCVFASGAAGAATEQYYSRGDFTRVEKIDAHVHIHGRGDRFMAQAVQDHMRILTINVDYPDFPPLSEQLRDAVSLKGRYPGQVAFAGAFSVQNFQSPGWAGT